MKWLNNQIKKVVEQEVLRNNYELLVELNHNLKNLCESISFSKDDLKRENIELKKKLAKLEDTNVSS